MNKCVTEWFSRQCSQYNNEGKAEDNYLAFALSTVPLTLSAFCLYVSMDKLNAGPIRPIYCKVLSIYSAYRAEGKRETLFGSGKLFGTRYGHAAGRSRGKWGLWSLLLQALDGEQLQALYNKRLSFSPRHALNGFISCSIMARCHASILVIKV